MKKILTFAVFLMLISCNQINNDCKDNKCSLDNNVENTKIVNTAAASPKVTKEKKIAKAALPAEEIIKSSNVGKIKLSSPKTGTLVKKGQILAKIKTMGIDNDVKATVNGTLKEVLVADGSAVDFAKELFKIEVN